MTTKEIETYTPFVYKKKQYFTNFPAILNMSAFKEIWKLALCLSWLVSPQLYINLYLPYGAEMFNLVFVCVIITNYIIIAVDTTNYESLFCLAMPPLIIHLFGASLRVLSESLYSLYSLYCFRCECQHSHLKQYKLFWVLWEWGLYIQLFEIDWHV